MAEKEYFLYIEGKRIEVTEEVYREYYRGERRERYFMEDLKRGRTITDPETKESRYVPGREDSYERLLEAGRDFPAPGESLEEHLHPETKNGGDRRSGKTRSAKCTSDPARSFVEDTAEKLGVNPCTVRRQIQTAKNLSPETKEIIRGADAKLSKKSALKLSRLEPEQQKEAATLLASREIRSVDEYAAKEKEAPEEISAQETSCGQQEPPEKGTLEDGGMNGGQRVSAASADMQKEAAASLKEIVAELKDPDKDCSGTPESFLAEYSAFVGKFHREIEWYSDPYYDTVYPALTEKQLARLRELTDSICSVAEEMYHRAEQMYHRTEHKRKG